MDGNSPTPHVQDTDDSLDTIQPRNDSFKNDNQPPSEGQSSLSGRMSAPKVHIVLDKDTFERKKIILVVPRGAPKSTFQDIIKRQKVFTLKQASNDQIESILQQSLNVKTFDPNGQATNAQTTDEVKPMPIVKTSTLEQVSKGLAPTLVVKKTGGQIGSTSKLHTNLQSISEMQPPGQPTSEVEPPAQPASEVEPPAQPTSEVEPPAQPASEVEPPAQPASEIQLPVPLISRVQPLQSTSEMRPSGQQTSEVTLPVQSISGVKLQSISEVQLPVQHASEMQLPVQPTSEVQSPVPLISGSHQLLQSTSEVQPSGQPTSEMQPSGQPTSEVVLPVKSPSGIKLQSISELQLPLKLASEVQLPVQQSSGVQPLSGMQPPLQSSSGMCLPVKTSPLVQQTVMRPPCLVQPPGESSSWMLLPLQPTSLIDPPVQSKSWVQIPAEPSSQIKAPLQVKSWLHIPVQPTCRVQPPLQSTSRVQQPLGVQSSSLALSNLEKQPTSLELPANQQNAYPVQEVPRGARHLTAFTAKQGKLKDSLHKKTGHLSTNVKKALWNKLVQSDQNKSLDEHPVSLQPVSLIQVVRNEYTVSLAKSVSQTASNVTQKKNDGMKSDHVKLTFPENQTSSIQPRSQYIMTPQLIKTKTVFAKKQKKNKSVRKKNKPPLNLADTAYLPTAINSKSLGMKTLSIKEEANSSSFTGIEDSSIIQENTAVGVEDESQSNCQVELEEIKTEKDDPFYNLLYAELSESSESIDDEELDEADLSQTEKNDPTLIFSDTELAEACLSSDGGSFDYSSEESTEETSNNKRKKSRRRKKNMSEEESEVETKKKRQSTKKRKEKVSDSESDIPKPRKERSKRKLRVIRFDTDSLYAFVIEEKTENEFVCRNCKKIFVTKAEAVSHMDIHHPFRCSICSMTFSDHFMIRKHLQKVHKVVQHCTQCTFNSKTLLQLERHFKEVHGDRSRFAMKHEEVCHLCGVLVKSRATMDKHMKKVHGIEASLREGELVCPVCNNPSSSFTAFIVHCLKHIGRYKYCKFEGCSFKSVLQAIVNSHYDQIHRGLRSFDCNHEGCSYKAKTSSMLHMHQMNTHSKVRNFHCPSCPKAFFNSYHLAVHKRIHDDVKPIACKHCEYRCRQKAALNWHMDKKHPEFVEVKAKVNYEQEPGVEAAQHRYKPGRKKRKFSKRKKKQIDKETMSDGSD